MVAWRTASRALASSNEDGGSSSSGSGSDRSSSGTARKWSSKEVSDAVKSYDNGKTDIKVSTKEQAEEIYVGIFGDKGYKNTTGLSPKEVKADEYAHPNGKNGTYHWDGPDPNHGNLPHLQVHESDGTVVRIFYN